MHGIDEALQAKVERLAKKHRLMAFVTVLVEIDVGGVGFAERIEVAECYTSNAPESFYADGKWYRTVEEAIEIVAKKYKRPKPKKRPSKIKTAAARKP
jgi:hypothetical protein